jgi:hypothetical protein
VRLVQTGLTRHDRVNKAALATPTRTKATLARGCDDTVQKVSKNMYEEFVLGLGYGAIARDI